MPDYTEKKTPSRQFLIDTVNTVYPGVIKDLVHKLREKKVEKRESKMKKFVLVKKDWVKKLKEFESKRKDEPIKPGRFIGLM